MQETENYFEKLNAISVEGKTDKKGNLTYLSWAYAWAELKKLHPEANYTVYENANGWNYHTDGKTAWVKVGVLVKPVPEFEAIEHIEYLPVMDHRNSSIPLKDITSFDINKAIQRASVKAIARHGIGLYIYAGEDLPEAPKTENPPAPKKEIKATTPQAQEIERKNQERRERLEAQKRAAAEKSANVNENDESLRNQENPVQG